MNGQNVEYGILQVLETAMEMEKRARDLYTRLAQAVKSPDQKRLLEHLANEEKGHHELFHKWLVEMEAFFKDVVVTAHAALLTRYMQSRLFPPDRLKEKIFSMKDLDAIFEFAIGMEMESMVLYSEIKPSVPADQRSFIDHIIAEEKIHLERLVSLKNKELF